MNEKKLPFINIDNEIKISEENDVHETIDFIFKLLTEKNYKFIILSGLNTAIKKVVLITEIIKSKIPNLHQINDINSLDKENEKMVPRLSIKLTFEPTDEEKQLKGYQSPLNIK